MSFLSDLIGGNFSNLGNDLFGSPTAIAETLGGIAAPLIGLPALASLAVPAAGEATALAAGGAGASGVGDLLSSLGLTASTVDPSLLGTAGAAAGAGGAPSSLATAGLGSVSGGAADVGTALGFAGDVPNAAGAVGGFNPPGVGYFPDFSSASLPMESFFSGNIPGADPLTSGSLSGLTGADLPQIPGDSFALGGYTGLPSPLTGGGAGPIPTTIGGTSPDISLPASTPSGGGLGTYEGNINTAANSGLGLPADTGISATLKSLGLSPGTLAGIGATGALGLGGQIFGPKLASAFGLNKPPGSDQLNQLASQTQALSADEQNYGKMLEQYMTTGQLPPGAQAAVDQATQAAIATTRSQFARMGMGSSAQEAQAIALIRQNASAQGFQIAMQMAQQGQAAINSAQQALGLTEQVYTNLMNATISQDQALSNSISNFSSAVGGGLAVGTGQVLAKQALAA